MFTLYTAECTGQAKNCLYPHRKEIRDAETLAAAVQRDYVCAAYRANYRNKNNFLIANCASVDFDNDHTEDPREWVRPEDVIRTFPDVTIGIHYSRNHMKEKKGKAARPRFHALIEIDPIQDAEEYARIKQQIAARFPQCDGNALDAARFFFGTEEAQVEYHAGMRTLNAVIAKSPDILTEEPDFDAGMRQGTYGEQVIREGSRNATLSRRAGKIVKRFGWNETGWNVFLKEAAKCEPPLTRTEVNRIWHSARRFAEMIRNQPGYIPPEEYRTGLLLKPEDYSDMGQAKVIAGDCGNVLVYTPGTDYLTYNGQYWDEARQKAVGTVENFLDRQRAEANREKEEAMDALEALGLDEKTIAAGGRSLEKLCEGEETQKALNRLQGAISYKKFVQQRRDMKYIVSAMQALKPMVSVEERDLDRDENLFNCPDGTYDLRKGMAGRKDHDASDLITKITPCAPGNQGEELWQDCIRKIFQDDQELIEYVQRVVGLAAVGEVYQEAMIIAYGEGSNGKSTFWNAIAGAMGTYGGMISADVLTVGCRRNVKPEFAEVKGKRILIAAELEEGMRLSTSIVKQLCSTDQIEAEKKYKDPFKFDPSHLLVLYTNHLPKVGAMDTGIWRRLIVIPFSARIDSGNGEIKNYAKYLLKNAGPAITKWIIEGAQKAIRDNFNLDRPRCVQEAIARYRGENDWLSQYLEECCETDSGMEAPSGEVYNSYRAFCARRGDFTRSTTEFYTALENRGFERIRRKNGRFIRGLRLVADNIDFDSGDSR